ncbi:putative eukaryotic translation initiation factor [Toxoplasma gondii TgCatPRC2]|uniref:Eukaryotic translation initiation factor 3 subunit B n=15 Tax=Toxoplasma gondii TaxID=5811 RepID=B9PYW7_TOXGV|nr:eukaryotic translation initiation factor, putative [Toxoplasma gondii ME49]EPR58434.1 putative eukaryotic translation initiation factor [Toxoplasma gondii GT1]ESS29992.1 putative eukaryotic translation initiation factor [Toxoplasma gondii VEG]KFG41770.1 putative eukaryotic translation initiation factor [Toxoplasma gondii GAB2-2007-GAL-DOM2]KFG61206.1 putative eukaryotic translation initiation factor [Toxoplasma gondii RUB]KFH03476.1 putative eukaryotic translation initiation factor [Toxopla|eukprot:XP_008886177.1 eukaryotic translation initiation factor, putative [Hammondia hammondi]
MVRIDKDDLPAEEQDLLEFLSEDSDEGEDDDSEQGEEKLKEKLSQMEPLLQMDYSFPSTIVLVGVPKVGKDKHEKLRLVLDKKMGEELLKKGAESVNEGLTISMPVNEETGMTKGFCFVTFSNQFNAQHAAHHLNGWALDAKHTFRAALLDDFDEIVGRGANYRPPIKLLGFTRENFRWWLLDARGREQFVIRYAGETEIYWHDPIERDCSVLVYNGHRERADGKRVWTDFRVQWSPQGSFLATFHRPGIALWAGDQFEKKVRFEHKDVKQIDFSPNETYVITWDGSPAQLRNEKAVRIWKVMTGELLRQFPTPAYSPRGGEYPHFLFSHDDRYVARMGEKELCVYQMECDDEPEAEGEKSDEKGRKDRCAVRLLRDPRDGKLSSLKYPLEKFEWSPTENIISVWIKGSEDAPGRLLLVEIPSRRELSSKNVYNVKGASMHWQSKGDFLCLRTVAFKKTGKKGKKEFTQLEIFRMREKDIPVDNVQLNDVAVQLHWEEGYSKRFALVVHDEQTSNQALRFYRVCDASEDGKRDTILIYSFDISGYMNYMQWSPFGSYFILASLGLDGTLLFCCLNDQDTVQVLHMDEHFMVNEVRWSACGRYLSTAVVLPMLPSSNTASFRLGSNTGYKIWTFQGKLQYKCQKDQFYQFLWRPHPPSLLKKEKIEEIKKKMKDYSKRYEAEDEKLRLEQRSAFIRQRKEEMDEFTKVLDGLNQWKVDHELYDDWQLAYETFDAQFDWEDKEEVIEDELEVKEEIIT